jgi:hypothetical protein
MFSIANSCSVAGIAVLDGAGDLSVYGAEYGLPDLGINLTRVPDTTPPVATGAQVFPASRPTDPNSSGNEGLTVDVNEHGGVPAHRRGRADIVLRLPEFATRARRSAGIHRHTVT